MLARTGASTCNLKSNPVDLDGSSFSTTEGTEGTGREREFVTRARPSLSGREVLKELTVT